MTTSIQSLIALETKHAFHRTKASNATIRFTVSLILILTLLPFVPLQAAERQVLHGNVPRAAAESAVMGQMDRSKHLHLIFSLPLRNQAELEALNKDLSDSTSPNYRHYLTPDQFAERFGPTEADYKSLADFVQANGMVVTQRHSNRTLLEVDAAVPAVEKTLHVNMVAYKHSVRGAYYAPDRDPSVDSEVKILGISGLNNFTLPRPAQQRKVPSMKRPPTGAAMKASMLDAEAQPTPLATGSGANGLFSGDDFRKAYAPGVTLTGKGQTIALVEFDGFADDEVQDNFKAAGLPVVKIQTVLLDGLDGSAVVWSGGTIVDVLEAGYMAPDATLMVYEGRYYQTILNRIATDNLAKQIGGSWLAMDPIADQVLLQFRTQGQTFFVESFNNGSYPLSVLATQNPNVTVVGGTNLTTSATGAWQAETPWSGSGGGVSTSYAIPDYQQGIANANNGASPTMRNFPDVAIVEDQILFINYAGPWSMQGGGPALWAGFTALVNEQAAAMGEPPVGFLNPALYAIAKGPNYSLNFHDINTGSSNGGFNAGDGYDLSTGLGSPAGQRLIDELTGVYAVTFTLSASPASVSVPASGTGLSTITITPKNGFTAIVSLTFTGVPAGVAAFLSAETITKSTLILMPSNTAKAGTYTITVQGTAGALNISTTIALTIPAPPISAGVSVALPYYVNGIIPDGASTANSLLDGKGWGYSGNLLGTGPTVTSHTFNGTMFSIGPVASNSDGTYTPNAITSMILQLADVHISTIKLLATAVNGTQTMQPFTVDYSDGTRTSYQQSMSDWSFPRGYAGESMAVSMPYRNSNTGVTSDGPYQLYEYSFSVDSSKAADALLLPYNRNVMVFAVTLVQ